MALNNGQVWDMVKELDDFVRDNVVTDWELDFISDMMDRRAEQRSYTPGQLSQILRLREKYL